MSKETFVPLDKRTDNEDGANPSKLDDHKLNAHQVDIRDDYRESERQARGTKK
ncbi:MAG: hypothetical protein WBW31_09545 [Candidatus Sulfotelmatobacter sp.]